MIREESNTLPEYVFNDLDIDINNILKTSSKSDFITKNKYVKFCKQNKYNAKMNYNMNSGFDMEVNQINSSFSKKHESPVSCE